MTETNKDQIIADVMSYLNTIGYDYDFDEIEDGSLRIYFQTDILTYVIIFNKDMLSIICPVIPNTNKENIIEVMRFLTMVNYGMKYGNLAMDIETGEVIIVIHTDYKGADHLPKGVIENAILFPQAIFVKYGLSIMEIALGVSDADTEFENIKGSNK